MDSIDQYFELVKQAIISKDLDEVVQGGLQARQSIIQLSGGENSTITAAVLYAAVIGCSNDGSRLNIKEKEMVDRVAGPIVSVLGQQAYDEIEKIADESDYGVIKTLTQLGQDFSMSLLSLILMFMYVDGVGSDDVIKKLRDIFQLNILGAMLKSGKEEVDKILFHL